MCLLDREVRSKLSREGERRGPGCQARGSRELQTLPSLPPTAWTLPLTVGLVFPKGKLLVKKWKAGPLILSVSAETTFAVSVL